MPLKSPSRGAGQTSNWRTKTKNNLGATMEIENKNGTTFESFYNHQNNRNNKALNFSLTKLIILWKHVRDSMLNDYKNMRSGQHKTISDNEFKFLLQKSAGDKLFITNITNLKNNNKSSSTTTSSNLSVNEAALLKMSILLATDIEIITEHFEMGSRIHFLQFYKFMEQKLNSTDLFELQQLSNLEDLTKYIGENVIEEKGQNTASTLSDSKFHKTNTTNNNNDHDNDSKSTPTSTANSPMSQTRSKARLKRPVQSVNKENKEVNIDEYLSKVDSFNNNNNDDNDSPNNRGSNFTKSRPSNIVIPKEFSDSFGKSSPPKPPRSPNRSSPQRSDTSSTPGGKVY